MKILVAYDGTLHAKKALRYGIQKLLKTGGDMTVLQVFDSGLFVDYDAGPRAEEMARSESARQLEEAKQIISENAAGLSVTVVAEEETPSGRSATTLLRSGPVSSWPAPLQRDRRDAVLPGHHRARDHPRARGQLGQSRGGHRQHRSRGCGDRFKRAGTRRRTGPSL